MARPEKVRLGEILVQQKLLSEDQLQFSLTEQKRTGRKLGRIFVENGFVKDAQVERIRRHLYFYADSQDASRYEELKERLALYRLVFGQPRQQDLLDRIQRTVRAESGRELSYTELTRYMINLSPLGKAHASARAA